MKQTIYYDDYEDALKDKFSHDARQALWEYFEELEADTGKELEFDTLGLDNHWREVDGAKYNLASLRKLTTAIDIGNGKFVMQEVFGVLFSSTNNIKRLDK